MGKKSGILVSHYPHQPGRACLGYQTSLIVPNLHCSLQNKAHYTSNDQKKIILYQEVSSKAVLL